MQIQIEVLTVTGPQYVKSGKGGYNTIELAYKDEGKVKGKKFVDLYTDKQVYAGILASKTGEAYSVGMEKEAGSDGKEYWVWKTFSKTDGTGTKTPEVSATVDAGPAKPVVHSGPGRVTGSNYETPEERQLRREFDKIKHRQIGRQGCINSAIEYLSAQSATKFEVSQVIEVAKKFEQFAFEPSVSVAELENDIPF